MEYGRGGKGRDKKDNDEISFSSAGPVVALGLTPLRLVEKETQGGDKIRRREYEGRQKAGSNLKTRSKMKTQRLCGQKKEREEPKIHKWNEDSWSEKGKCKIHYATRKRDKTSENTGGSTENTKSVPKRVRNSRESVLSRSPLRGTSMQDETRMHVSVQRSASSKEENEVKVKREKRICERE